MIFKSQQVNLDPEPWVNPKAGTRYSTEGGLLRDYLPRPEFEPTRDPLPWYLDGNLVAPTLRADHRRDAGYVWAPRREQFDTPVNRVLVFFRDYYEARMVPLAVAARNAASVVDEMAADYTPDEIEHARRVLTRLARL